MNGRQGGSNDPQGTRVKTMELWTADGRPIARCVRLECSFRLRYACLSRDAPIGRHDGLLRSPGGSIHTLGMRRAIDVVFLSRQMRIVGLAPNIPPWRFRRAPSGTGRVLELAAGQIAIVGLEPGMFVVVESEEKIEPPTVVCRGGARRISCQRLPIQFSLRLPLDRRCGACSIGQCSNKDEAGAPDQPP